MQSGEFHVNEVCGAIVSEDSSLTILMLQVTMLDTVPGLMNAIRMINSYSRYYNTSEHMTALFVKVTNQMITACKNHITDNGYHKVSKFFDHLSTRNVV